MNEYKNAPLFYIGGQWVTPASDSGKHDTLAVINPASEETIAQITLGKKEDVDTAVAAAKKAFKTYQKTSLEQRITWLEKLHDIYEARYEDMARAISQEMGAPMSMAREEHAASGLFHLKNFIDELKVFPFEYHLHDDPAQRISHQPIGVCGLITPWNWPINQLSLKIVPALAVGCTVVLKPSEVAPLSAVVFAEMIDEAGFPEGVFNMVHGDGKTVGAAISSHPDIRMVSFTGSTVAGKAVMKAAADTVKKVTLELGGKSPNIVFADADLERVVKAETSNCFGNTGQTCVAPTRMIVEASAYDEVLRIAQQQATQTKVGHSHEEGDHIGPLSSSAQYEKVQEMIQAGIDEGARLLTGGTGKPEGFDKGYYVKPTVFADVNNEMRIAKEEIFGPVLSIIPFNTEEEAIDIANDTPYGLNARVQTSDLEKAHRVARQLEAGMVQINGVSLGAGAPFGGVKQSGIGREGGKWGLEDYLEVKIISGWS